MVLNLKRVIQALKNIRVWPVIELYSYYELTHVRSINKDCEFYDRIKQYFKTLRVKYKP